ncbi:hypothetical protein MRB53_020682 [Persea americana]|uniref:Uncharacterized protein n=1 Tax=Persea americana TaxID=3435 RepID=A0ACC2L1T4_PERAE|nr:hypothetical protein MRB53_020682 [Persea americana]
MASHMTIPHDPIVRTTIIPMFEFAGFSDELQSQPSILLRRVEDLLPFDLLHLNMQRSFAPLSGSAMAAAATAPPSTPPDSSPLPPSSVSTWWDFIIEVVGFHRRKGWRRF